jgi:RimK family alpha-L-glutamate ligase
MKILIAGLVKNYQLLRIREEAIKRGHKVDGCFAADLYLLASSSYFEPKLYGKDITSYDLIYMIVGKRRWEWYTAASFLAEKYKTIIVNKKTIDPTWNYFLTPAYDYFLQHKAGLPFPVSAILMSKDNIDQVLAKFSFPVIVKSSTGRQGRGVYLAKNRQEVDKAADEILKDAPSFIIREFIPNDGDIRVFTVGYQAVAGMKRIPKEGEFRSNISQGGRGEKFDLEAYPSVKDIAEKASKLTRTEIAGVDIIINKENGKPYILEINPAPQFEGLEKHTKFNAALEIVKYFETLYTQRR